MNEGQRSRYELRIRAGKPVSWEIEGSGHLFAGTGPRGYLTKPPIIGHGPDGEEAFSLGGNRRIAPRSHILAGPDGSPIAIFDTRMVVAAVGKSTRRIHTADGGELATLVGVDSLRSDRLRITVEGHQIGEVGRKPRTHHDDTERSRWLGFADKLVRGPRPWIVTTDVEMDPRVSAAILLYARFVIEPSRRVE